MEDSFGIDVLLESWSKPTETEGTSVNRPEARPPANAVAPGGEEAGPSFMLGQGKADGPLPGEASSAFSVDVSQDDIWAAVDAEEKKQWKALISSKEVERHNGRREARIKEICLRAKEIAQAKGWNPECCEGVELAAKFIAEDVEDIPEQWQFHFLANLIRDLNNPNSETWKRIKL